MRFLTVRAPTTCAECHRTITAGETAARVQPGAPVWCAGCADRIMAARANMPRHETS